MFMLDGVYRPMVSGCRQECIPAHSLIKLPVCTKKGGSPLAVEEKVLTVENVFK
jgi:hypothetical protein